MQRGFQEAKKMGALEFLGKATGVVTIGNNFRKSWEEGRKHPWQAALHLFEGVGQLGISVAGGEEIELLFNLGSMAVDTGIDYYNHSHK